MTPYRIVKTSHVQGDQYVMKDGKYLGRLMQVDEPLLSRAEWEATIEDEVEAVEVPAYEYYDGARAQVGVLYEVRATVLYPGRYGIIAVGIGASDE